MHLRPCPFCRRHIRATEWSCPFCDSQVRGEDGFTPGLFSRLGARLLAAPAPSPWEKLSARRDAYHEAQRRQAEARCAQPGSERRVIYGAPPRGPDWLRGMDISLDPARCVGCGACVSACATQVFAQGPDGRALVAAPERCGSSGRCAAVCPSGALTLRAPGQALRKRRAVVPVSYEGETAIRGLYALNPRGDSFLFELDEQARRAIHDIAAEASAHQGHYAHDLVIVGAGPGGLAAGLYAQQRGLRALLLEAGPALADTVRRTWPSSHPLRAVPSEAHRSGGLWYYTGPTPTLASSTATPRDTALWLAPGATREQLLRRWEEQARGLSIVYGQRVTKISPIEEEPEINHPRGQERRRVRAFSLTAEQEWRAPFVLLACLADHATRLQLPGEELPGPDGAPRVRYSPLPWPEEAPRYRGQRCLVLGQRENAVRWSLALAEAGATVTIGAIRHDLPVDQALCARLFRGEIRHLARVQVLQLRPRAVVLRWDRAPLSISRQHGPRGVQYQVYDGPPLPAPRTEELAFDAIFADLGRTPGVQAARLVSGPHAITGLEEE